jgi:hypothetical protein
MAATVKELAQYLGRSGRYHVQGMKFAVKVVDARVSFGAVQLQIAPYSGAGRTWVYRDSVMLSVEEDN